MVNNKMGCRVKDLILALQQLENKDAIVYTNKTILHSSMIHTQQIKWKPDEKKYECDHLRNGISTDPKAYNGVYFQVPDEYENVLIGRYYPKHMNTLFDECKEYILGFRYSRGNGQYSTTISMTSIYKYITDKLYAFNRVIYFFPDVLLMIDSNTVGLKYNLSPLFSVHSDLIWVSKIPYETFNEFVNNPVMYCARMHNITAPAESAEAIMSVHAPAVETTKVEPLTPTDSVVKSPVPELIVPTQSSVDKSDFPSLFEAIKHSMGGQPSNNLGDSTGCKSIDVVVVKKE
jgi:hypothetical protein